MSQTTPWSWRLWQSSKQQDPAYDQLLDEELDGESQHIPTPGARSYRLAYGIFFLQGASMLLTWNVFITASEYFRGRFASSGFESTFSNWFTFGFMASQLFFLWHATVTQRKVDVKNRIATSLFVNTIALGTTMISVLWFPFSSTAYFFFIMLIILLAGINGSYLQNGLIALVARFDSVFMQAVMSGQGAIGVIVAIVQISTAAGASTNDGASVETAASDLTKSAFIYFLLSTIFAAGSFFAHFALLRLDITRQILVSTAEADVPTSSMNVIRIIAKKIYLLIYSIVAVFTITLGVFPSLTSTIVSSSIPDHIFIPIHFLVFNTGDWLGRTLPASKRLNLTTSDKTLAILTTLRVIFIPLLLACNVGSHKVIPYFIHSDSLYMLILLLCSCSNGYLSSLVMMNQRYVDKQERDIAGTLLAYMLSVGLTLGSIISFGIKAAA